MTKYEFLNVMRFPAEWVSLNMYPDELFQWQIGEYELGHENGAEHDRNSAFHWWFRRDPSKTELKNIVRLAALDPDPFLAQDLRQYIHKAAAFDEQVAEFERQLFAGR